MRSRTGVPADTVWQQLTEHAASLQMENIFGKPPTDKFKLGEPFMDTAMRNMSAEAKAEMAREAFEED